MHVCVCGHTHTHTYIIYTVYIYIHMHVYIHRERGSNREERKLPGLFWAPLPVGNPCVVRAAQNV
jgi:hypothetical protein